MPDVQPDPTPSNVARLSLRAGKVRLAARVEITSTGLLAVGGLVCGILLSTAALVWVSTSVPRRHPIATAVMRRR